MKSVQLKWSAQKFDALLHDTDRPLGSIAAEIAIAAETGTSPADLRAWRSGRVKPSVDTMFAIAYVLGVPLAELTEAA